MTDWKYVIKMVWGNSPTHDGPLHFKASVSHMAVILARHKSSVLLYETKFNPNGSQCVFGVGQVPGDDPYVSSHLSGGEHFDCFLPFDLRFELPATGRQLGVHKSEIEGMGIRIRQTPGGVIPVTEEQFKALAAALEERNRKLRAV